MSVAVTHSFISNIPDGSNPNLAKPSDWNAAHLIKANGPCVLGVAASGAAQTVSELSPTTAGQILSWNGSAIAWTATLGPLSGINLIAGAAINWASGDIVIFHQTNQLVFQGGGVPGGSFVFDNTIQVASSATNFEALALVSTDPGATNGPLLTLTRNSASPAAADTIGAVQFWGKDSAANFEAYAQIFATITNPTNAAEGSIVSIQTRSAGAFNNTVQFSGGTLTFLSNGVLSWNANVIATHVNASSRLDITTGGFGIASSGDSAGNHLTIAGAAPIIKLDETDAGAGKWFVVADGGQLDIRPTTIGTSPVISFAPTTVFTQSLVPRLDGTYPLGSTSFRWTGLWLGSGSAIDWASGNVTLTHSANFLGAATSNNGQGGLTINQTNTGASAQAVLGLNTNASGVTQILQSSTAGGPFSMLQSSIAGDLFIDKTNATGNIILRTGAGPTEAARVDNAQKVVIGGSAAVAVSTLTAKLQVLGTDVSASFTVQRYSADTNPARIAIAKSRGGLGAQSLVSSGDGIGELLFYASDGTGFINLAGITAIVDTTPGTNDMPGRLSLSTAADGAATVTERLRIDSNGFHRVIGGSFGRENVITKTADFTLAATENWVINNKSGATCTVTMPAASTFPGREVHFQNNQAQTLVSNASNVIPKGGGAAATAILPATATAWAILVSNGTNWVIMLSGT